MSGRSAALIVVVMSLAACGGSPPDPAAGSEEPAALDESPGGSALPSVDVCRLVPGDIVASLLGGSVTEEHRSDSGDYQGCDYVFTPPGGGYEFVAVWIQPGNTIREPESVLETGRGLGHDVSTETIDGLGDRAFVVRDATEAQATVYVVRGGVGVEVTAGTAERARTLAEHVLARAPEVP